MADASLPDPLILVSPEFHSGEPVFNRTRVPIKAMFDYLEAGDPLDEFLEDFPDVTFKAVLKIHIGKGAPAWAGLLAGLAILITALSVAFDVLKSWDNTACKQPAARPSSPVFAIW